MKRVFVIACLALCARALSVGVGAASARESESLIDRALEHPEFTWESYSDEGLTVYYQAGSLAERHRIMLWRSAKGALEQGRGFLGQEPDDRPLRVLYVDSRNQMEQLTGRGVTGLAVRNGYGVFLVWRPEWRSFDTHEISHLLTLGRWGDPVEQSDWMIEGVPIAVDGWCQTAGVDRIAAYLVSAGMWPGLDKFLPAHRALGEVPGGVFAASLIRCLRDRFDPGVIETVWRWGLEEALEPHNMNPADLENRWLDWLESDIIPITETTWVRLDQDGCG